MAGIQAIVFLAIRTAGKVTVFVSSTLVASIYFRQLTFFREEIVWCNYSSEKQLLATRPDYDIQRLALSSCVFMPFSLF